MVFLSSLVSALSYDIVRSSIVGVEDVRDATVLSAIEFYIRVLPVYTVQVVATAVISLSVAFMSK